MDKFTKSPAKVPLDTSFELRENLALVFNSDVVRRDATAQRIVAGLPLCDGAVAVNALLKQLNTRLMTIEANLMASSMPQTQRPAHRSRLKIRI